MRRTSGRLDQLGPFRSDVDGDVGVARDIVNLRALVLDHESDLLTSGDEAHDGTLSILFAEEALRVELSCEGVVAVSDGSRTKSRAED